MYKFKDVLILPSGVPITSGDITVRDSVTEVAVTVYEDDETTPISQPFSPDNEGNVVFKAPNGVYDILLNGAVERDEIVFFDFGDSINFPNGNLFVGVNDTTAGTLSLYGPGTGNAEGGQVTLYMGADYDTTYEYYAVDVYEDDFRIGRQGTTDFQISANGNIDLSKGTLNIGINDTTAGNLNLYGPGTGVTQGGRVTLYVGADYDTTFNYFTVDVNNDNFRIGRQGISSDLIIDASGILHFGTHAAIGAETVTGYITIKDSGGTSRKIAVVS